MYIKQYMLLWGLLELPKHKSPSMVSPHNSKLICTKLLSANYDCSSYVSKHLINVTSCRRKQKITQYVYLNIIFQIGTLQCMLFDYEWKVVSLNLRFATLPHFTLQWKLLVCGFEQFNSVSQVRSAYVLHSTSHIQPVSCPLTEIPKPSCDEKLKFTRLSSVAILCGIV